MPVTLTIKQVPDHLAENLRLRAAANRRSQQQELLLMLERAMADSASSGVAESSHSVYRATPAANAKAAREFRPENPALAQPATTGKLDLDTLWQRARQFGTNMPSEASAIVRADRDADHG